MRWLRTCAAPWTMLSLGRRTPTSPAQNRNTCSAPCWRIPTALPGCCWRLWGSSSPRPCGSAASFRVSSSCPASPAAPPMVSWTRSSAGKRSWIGWWKFCAAARRTTPALWGSRAWARPRWPKGWLSALPPTRCPGCSKADGCWRWIWPALWRARSTGATLRNGSRTCWKSWCGMVPPSCSWTNSTPSSEPGRRKAPSTRPAS